MATTKRTVADLAEAEAVVRMMDPGGDPDPVLPPASRAPFDPKPYIIKIQGKEYLPVRARLMWMRYDHGTDWGIETETERSRDDEGTLNVRAIIRDRTYAPKAESRNDYAEVSTMATVATGLASAPTNGKFPALMKAETAAIGRALAHAGYGTEFIDDEDDVVDGPVAHAGVSTPAGPVMLWRQVMGQEEGDLINQMREDLFLIRARGTMEHMLSWRRHYAEAPAEAKADLRDLHNAVSDELEAKRK